MDPRRLEMTVLMTPDMANFSGKVHGGALLNLLAIPLYLRDLVFLGRFGRRLQLSGVDHAALPA